MIERVEKICTSCNRVFFVEPAFSWQRLCRSCYAGERSAKQQLIELQAENAQLKVQLSALRLSGPSRLDPRRWRQLLQLCHPDHHANSVAANDATRWLLEIRSEVEQ
jgi:hypothetical protein